MTAVLTKDTLMGHVAVDTHCHDARQGQTPEPTNDASLPIRRSSAWDQATGGQTGSDARFSAAPGSDSEQGPSAILSAISRLRPLADPALAFAADILDDLERTRNANANRLRVMTTVEADADGEIRGFGLDESHPDVARLSAMVTALDGLAHDAVLQLRRQMRRHPLGPWAKAQRGIGEKQAARLLAAVGDPYWNTLHNRPRTVSELWAYCGLHTLPSGDHALIETQAVTVAARRTKGQKSNWSTNAKTRAWLCIESCMKQIDATCKGDNGIGTHIEGCKCSPYRIVIDQRRTHTAETHPEWTPGHSLSDAMRIASKALLRDLWREAKRIHEEQS
jgi:hypothetical protein